MSERLSEEERAEVISEVGAVARRFAVNRSTMAGPSVLSLTLAQLPELIEASVYPAVEAILTARLADQAARLAAVETLPDALDEDQSLYAEIERLHLSAHVGAADDIQSTVVRWLRAALNPNPGETST